MIKFSQFLAQVHTAKLMFKKLDLPEDFIRIISMTLDVDTESPICRDQLGHQTEWHLANSH